MKKHSQWARFCFAMAGLRATWQREQSFRTEVVLSTVVVGVLAFQKLEPVWWALVALSVAGLLSAEVFNTSIETVCDALHPDIHPLIKIAKDCASAAVFLMVIAVTALLGMLVLHIHSGGKIL